MRARAGFWLIVLALATTSCGACQKPAPVVPDDGEGDYPPPGGIIEVFADGSPEALASPCGSACMNLDFLGCREGRTNALGVTCYRACLEMAGHQRIPTKCWATAQSINAVRACGSQLRCIAAAQ